MKIPPNMTEEEVLQTIKRVSRRYAKKFTFGYYGEEDIMQEAFMISLEAMEKYDGLRPLENFLAVHIRNRLIVFVRDNYYRKESSMTDKGKQINETKRMIMDTMDIDLVDMDRETRLLAFFDPEHEIDVRELVNLIDGEIDVDMREDYLKYLDGGKMSKTRKENLINHIQDIVEGKYAAYIRPVLEGE